ARTAAEHRGESAVCPWKASWQLQRVIRWSAIHCDTLNSRPGEIAQPLCSRYRDEGGLRLPRRVGSKVAAAALESRLTGKQDKKLEKSPIVLNPRAVQRLWSLFPAVLFRGACGLRSVSGARPC